MKVLSIFLIGGAGFIGSHLVSAFARNGWRMFVIDQIENPFRKHQTMEFYKIKLPNSKLGQLLKEHRPNFLVFAAGTADVRASMKNPYEDFSTSTDLYFWTIDQVRCFSPETKVIFLSSAAVYGNPEALPVKEADPVRPISPYGYHKLFCERISAECSSIYNMEITSFRIFSAFGPGLRRQVVWDIANKIISSYDNCIVLRGTGTESRDFISVEDISSIISRFVETNKKVPPIMNMASGTETTILKLSTIISKLLGGNKTISFSGQEDPGMPIRWQADVSLLKSTGLFLCEDINIRLQKTIEWIKEERSRSQFI